MAGTPALVAKEETFFIKYILKPQPLSTGKYLLTVKPGENFKVCKLVVTHIGQNFPCAQINGDIPADARSTTWGYAGEDFAINTDVVLSFSVSAYTIDILLETQILYKTFTILRLGSFTFSRV